MGGEGGGRMEREARETCERHGCVARGELQVDNAASRTKSRARADSFVHGPLHIETPSASAGALRTARGTHCASSSSRHAAPSARVASSRTRCRPSQASMNSPARALSQNFESMKKTIQDPNSPSLTCFLFFGKVAEHNQYHMEPPLRHASSRLGGRDYWIP